MEGVDLLSDSMLRAAEREFNEDMGEEDRDLEDRDLEDRDQDPQEGGAKLGLGIPVGLLAITVMMAFF